MLRIILVTDAAPSLPVDVGHDLAWTVGQVTVTEVHANGTSRPITLAVNVREAIAEPLLAASLLLDLSNVSMLLFTAKL